MEVKKDNKELIVLVCILSALVLVLGGFIIYDIVLSKKEPNACDNSNIKDNINNQNKEENSNDIDNNIKVSIGKNNETGYYNQLVINGKTIQKEYETLDNVIFLDNSYIIATFKDDEEGFSRFYVYNKDGEMLKNIDDLSSLKDGHIIDLSYSDGLLHIQAVTSLAGDNYSSLCYHNQSDIYSKFELIKYIGNGKFEYSRTISSFTTKEYLKNNYNYTCN